MVGGCLQASAQQSSSSQPDSQPPSFPTLFPNPTNNNGFEEFVKAADLVQNIDDIDQAVNPGAALALKRRVLDKSECKQALELIREGLVKPTIAPKQVPWDGPGLPIHLPIGGFMKLGHLMAIEQYVDCADGSVDAAITSLHAGLAFGYRIQSTSIISGITGIIVDTSGLTETAAHLGQLSVFNCDRVVQIVRDLLAADCPGIRLLEQAKTDTVNHLDILKKDPLNFLEMVADDSSLSDADMTASILALKSLANGPPGDVDAVVADAQMRITAQFDTAIQNMRMPVSQRKPLGVDGSNSPANAISRRMTTSLQKNIDRYAGDQARIRLLGVQALIRRYEWDHNSLPASLNDIDGDDLITDPFTGDHLAYKRDEDRYTLTSVGPMKSDGTQQRDPVQLH
jgi:hypothetical protein